MSEPIYISVSQIVNAWFPYKEPIDRKRREKGLEAEIESSRLIEYTKSQLRMEIQLQCDIPVVIIGIADFVDENNNIIYEVKSYPAFNPKVKKRVQLQVSIYALMYSMIYGVNYEEVKTVIVDEVNNKLRTYEIEKMNISDVIRYVCGYVKQRMTMPF